MSRTLFFSLLALLSCKVIIAENHHLHEKKDTVIIVENAKDHHHHNCELSAKARLLQITRQYVRPALTIVTAGTFFMANHHRNLTKRLAIGTVAGCVGFSAGHLLKKGCKLAMFLNDISKK